MYIHTLVPSNIGGFSSLSMGDCFQVALSHSVDRVGRHAFHAESNPEEP